MNIDCSRMHVIFPDDWNLNHYVQMYVLQTLCDTVPAQLHAVAR